MAGIAGLALLAQAGCGAVEDEPDTPAATTSAPPTFPESSVTFAFAPPGSEVEVGTLATEEMRVPAEADLAGTSWELQDDLPRDGGSLQQVTGSAAGTTLSFGDEQRQGWGVDIETCGGVWAQEDLELDPDGAFGAGEVMTTDLGCPTEVQTMEDFWMAALPQGGTIHLVDGSEVLLLSVPEPDDAQTSGDEPGNGDALPDWTPAGEQTSSDGGLGAGGPLFAPDLRAGRHEDFDRIVLDLTAAAGEGTADLPGWLAAYPDEPVVDAAGRPAGVAGDSLLRVIVSGMAYPEPGDPVYDDGELRMQTPGLERVVEAARFPPFEGQLDVVIGVSGEPRPYRVLVLEEPARVVIDVQH